MPRSSAQASWRRCRCRPSTSFLYRPTAAHSHPCASLPVITVLHAKNYADMLRKVGSERYCGELILRYSRKELEELLGNTPAFKVERRLAQAREALRQVRMDRMAAAV